MREPRAMVGSSAHRRLIASLIVGVAACDDTFDAPAPSAEPAASEEVRAVAPPTSPSEACAQDLAAETPAAVRATLDDLGYGLLFDDACVAQRAEHEDDVSLCAGQSLSTLRERCAMRVAVRHGHPDDCPEARTLPGRDPLCVALAARDRRLCAAAGVIDRAICEQALGRERACVHLPDTERESCASRALDFASRIEGDVRTTPALEPRCVLTSVDGAAHPTTSADRGVRLVYRGCVRVLVMGDAEQLATPFGRAGIAMSLAAEGPGEVSLEATPLSASSLAATLDGSHTLHASGGSVTLTTLEAELGGVAEGTFHATFPSGAAPLDGSFRSYVRDLEPRPEECPEP